MESKEQGQPEEERPLTKEEIMQILAEAADEVFGEGEDKPIILSGEEAFKMLQEQIGGLPTIQELIEVKKKEDLMMKLSFKAVNAMYNDVSYGRKKIINHLNRTKLTIQLSKALSYLLFPRNLEAVKGIEEKVDSTKTSIQEKKELLKSIRQALKDLEKNEVGIGIIPISMLLEAIFERDKLLMEKLSTDVSAIHLANKGISFYGTNKNQEALEEVESRINSSAMHLGLKQ